MGQLILNKLKFGEVNVSNTIQVWIAIIETTRHKSSCKWYCTIQIKVTMSMLQIIDMLKAWAAGCSYMWAEGEIFVKYYSLILCRFCWDSFFYSKQLNRKHREITPAILGLFSHRSHHGLTFYTFQLRITCEPVVNFFHYAHHRVGDTGNLLVCGTWPEWCME